MQYIDFLQKKIPKTVQIGFDTVEHELSPELFDWQKEVVKWALKKGRSAIFADCGLGKTFMQLEWADQVHKKTGGNILILAPLAVSLQTKREGAKLGVNVNICRTENDIKTGINITNYEMIEHFSSDKFIGVVIDESSILKSFAGKIKEIIIDTFKNTPYKLACTATPSPNDYMELGNHSEFLNVMTRSEMLATYFVHDSGDTAKWRLKGHAESEFWKWISSWALVMKSPNDLGFNDEGYILPGLTIHEHFIESEPDEGSLIAFPAQTLSERREARKKSVNNRVKIAADIVNRTNEIFLVWCDFNEESEKLTAAINGAVEITGSHTMEYKAVTMIGFASGNIKCLVTKPKIAGFGMNWQNCSNMIFCGLSDSYEQFYQAIRRCWRFGQKKAVNVHIVISEKESSVLLNIKRKEHEAEKMSTEMIKLTNNITKNDIKSTSRIIENYNPEVPMELPNWIGVS